MFYCIFLGGDQGLLNTFFSDWAVKDIDKHLPFIYNLSANAIYTYLPAFYKYVFNRMIKNFLGVKYQTNMLMDMIKKYFRFFFLQYNLIY